MSEPRASDDPMARTARTMGIITAVLTALVAFNTLVYSCSNDRKAREEAALERLKSDEEFWAEAMKDLGTLIDKRPTGITGNPNWDAQCSLLADRTVKLVASADGQSSEIAEDVEIEFEFQRARQARIRVNRLRQTFQARMQDEKLIGSCASNFTVQLKQTEEANRISNQLDWSEITNKARFGASPQQLESIGLESTSIALTPPSKDRWDVDVFWCARRDPAAQSANFSRAVNEGLKIAGMAQRGERIGTERLGQVRVRILTQSAQKITGPFTYFKSGNRLLHDRGDRAETNLVTKLAGMLNQSGTNGTGSGLANGDIEVTEQGRPSKWYISLFVCEAGADDGPSPGEASSFAN